MDVPGVSPNDLAAALGEFERVVGKQWVFTGADDVALYRDAFSPLKGEADELVASAAVAPASAEEVQAVVRIANKYKIPLYPVSTGRNLGYGGSAPVMSGNVVLDLKRMNRIIEVNDRNNYAIVEPGVSYFDLYNYIQEKGLKVWVDVPDPGWGSLIGNALDRGGGYLMPQFRNHFDSHCGMEVVLPNGELLRTGMGGVPDSKCWPQFKAGYGPWIDGMFSQSNFGVVTKMGFWLMPEPEAYLKSTVLAYRYEDLGPLIDTLNYLEDSRIVSGIPNFASPLLGQVSYDDLEEMLSSGPPKVAPELQALRRGAVLGYTPEIQQYALANDLAYWQLNLVFYGPAKVVQAQWEAAKERYSAAIKGVRFIDGEILKIPLTGAQKEKVHYPEFGIPSLKLFALGARSKFMPNPTAGHMFFSPIIPRTAEAVIEANKVFLEAARDLKLPIPQSFRLPSCFWERSFIYVFNLPVTEDIKMNRHIIAGMKELIKIAAAHGWSEYRTPPLFQDTVQDVFSFNDNILRRFHETVKDAIDPNGIISPGRYGIWPKHLRKT